MNSPTTDLHHRQRADAEGAPAVEETSDHVSAGSGRLLREDEIRDILEHALSSLRLEGKRVLIVIPDGTRTAPVPMFFRLFYEVLGSRVSALDYLVALGTHQPMNQAGLGRLVGVGEEERSTTYAEVKVLNHRWDLPGTLVAVGTIPAGQIAELTGGLLVQDLPVTVNRLIYEYDQLIICGPVTPHEVVGFSGGNKYLFPGISGPDVINFTHWLGALHTSYKIIGAGYTPVRAVIDRAASLIDLPKFCFAFVVQGRGIAGLYAGTPEEAWQAAADLSARLHVRYVSRPFRRVLSVMPRMYDDLWTAAKGMYKVEPAVADGGEVIIYAPHIDEISYTHGKIIDAIGYHVRDYFVQQWDRFKHYPWGVLAHSTHLRGIGSYDSQARIEHPRIRVTLATGISRERCERVNLGYKEPSDLDPSQWEGREGERVLVVPKAGDMLYRLASEPDGPGEG